VRRAGHDGSTAGPVNSPARVRDNAAPAWLIESVRPDLRAEFQRTLSEPRSVSRRATLWWPAVAGLEEVVDAVTAAAMGADHGMPLPPPRRVRELIAALEAIAEAERSGTTPPRPNGRPEGENPVADAVHRVQAALA
jgi:hypothetical protein